MNPSIFLKSMLPLSLAIVVGQSARAQRPPALVVVAAAVEKEIAAGHTFVATVMPLKRAVVGSAVAGRVAELVVREGQRVGKHEPILKMLTVTIELELAEAEAVLELHAQELAELENGSRPQEIVQAKAKMLGAKANLQYTQASLARAQKLYNREGGAITEDQYERIVANQQQAEQAFDDASAAYKLAVEGPRPERIAQARAHVAIQQAQVNRIKDRIKKYTVITRFDGYVVAEHVEEGAWIKVGDPVMEVVALDEVKVVAFVVEQHVPHVKPGMTVRVEVPALPSRVFSGVVTKILPQADTRARTFPVKILVRNEIGEAGPLLKAGMYARVELPTGPPQQAVMVPKDALVLGGPRPVVYVVDGDTKKGKANPVPVELGVATPNLIQVKGPLKAGQLVVVEGNERLRPGQDVVITRVVLPKMAAAVNR